MNMHFGPRADPPQCGEGPATQPGQHIGNPVRLLGLTILSQARLRVTAVLLNRGDEAIGVDEADDQ